MSFFKNLRLSTRIYFQQAFLVLALIVAAIFVVINISSLKGDLQTIESKNLPLKQAANDLDLSVYHMRMRLSNALRLGAAAFGDSEAHNGMSFEEAKRKYEEAISRMETERAEAREDQNRVITISNKILEGNHKEEFREQYQRLITEVEKIGGVIDEHERMTNEVLSLLEQGNMQEYQQLSDKMSEIEDDVALQMDEVIKASGSVIQAPMNEAVSLANNMVAFFWGLAIVVTLIALAMGIYSGKTLNALRDAMTNIRNSIQQVASASSQSSTAITQVSDGSRQQSEAIQQAVTAVNQSVSVLNDVSGNAEQARNLSTEGAEKVRDGKAHMEEMVTVVNRISENSSRINKITEVINDIASQTNMLSLNAAIEAARAGEHGKGFAVVAEQVRKLAESSRNSVEDIVQLINEANTDADSAVDVANRVNEQMGQIENASDETTNMMQSIATSIEQQVATNEELQQNMDTLKSIGENNANASEEITETIMELHRISDETNNEVNKFNI